MRKITLILLLLLGVSQVVAQEKAEKVTLSGTVIDSTTNTLSEYATIILHAPEDATKAVASTFTDGQGKFTVEVPAGNYGLIVNAVGYASKKQAVELTQDVELGMINISAATGIEAVTVTAQLVTSDIDKTTYNTEMDPEAPALTALEMMRKVPMLTVDGEDNLKLKGQGNFKILVNGKSSTLMSGNYKEVLRSMPANTIKRIEVITDPPAKYDAEGVAGIINIITVRKTLDGFVGNVSAGVNTFGGYNGGGYLAISSGKFSISGNLNFSTFENPNNTTTGELLNFLPTMEATNYRQTFYQTGNGGGDYYGANINGSYEFDSLNLLTFGVSGNLGGYGGDNSSLNEIFSKAGDPTAKYTNRSESYSDWGSVAFNVDYQRSFADNKDRMLTASYKVDYSPNNSNYNSWVDMEFNQGAIGIEDYTRRSDNKAWGMEHAAQIDYFDPINENHQIETGAKYVLRPSMSNSFNEELVNGEWIENDRFKNDLDYFQHIGSLYGAYQFKLKDFSVKGGARAEYTYNNGTFKNAAGDSPVEADYFNVIPYLTFGYKLDDTQNLRLGYTQRISRPGIYQLNPYIDDSEPAMVQTGNPDLEAEIAHSFNLGYGMYKPLFNINASLSARLVNNSIEYISTPYGLGIMTRPENIGQSHNYTFSTYAGVRLWNGVVSLSLGGNVSYMHINTNDGSGRENHGWTFNGNGYFNVQLWKDASFSGYGGFGSNGVSLQSSGGTYYYTGLSLTQRFFEKSLGVTLSASDPFNQYQKYSMTMIDPNFQTTYNNTRESRNFRLSLSWRFGKTSAEVKRTRRSISNDDSSGSGGGAPSGAGGGGGGM